MKKIIVPIDFSKTSVLALKYAISVAQKMDASVMMVNVVKYKDYEKSLRSPENQILSQVEQNFTDLISKYGSQVPGSLEYRVRDGKVAEEITNQAKYSDASMIILGAHGLSGFEELWIGNNAFRVVSMATCPVITIRKGECAEKMPERIVMPLDSTFETTQKIDFTLQLAQKFGAEIHVLSLFSSLIPNIKDKVETSTHAALQQIEAMGIPFVKTEKVADNLTDATIDYALKAKAGLISIMTEQEFSPRNIFLGPYAQQMISRSPIPILSHRTKVLHDTDETGLF